MTLEQLHAYAEQEIERMALGDSETNCHGVVAHIASDGVRLSDGVGLDVTVTTQAEIDSELAAMAAWYAEASAE